MKGSHQAFVAIGFYNDNSSENISNEVFWSSAFSEIATITEIGIAKGVDVGITSIKAIKDGVISNELSLVVTAAVLESIQITPATVSLAKGNRQQYTAMGFYSDETSRELTQEVSWRSRDTSTATISEAGLAFGVGVGNSTITAVKDGVMSNDGRLTVTAAALESIQITPAVVSLAKGNSQQYTALGFYSDETSRELTQEVSWRSRDTSTATISEAGLVVGVGVGNSTITAVKDGVMSNDARLTVTAAALESIQITPAVVSLAKGNSQQYTAMGFYSDETSRELTQEVSWRSRDTSIATISEAGLVVGVGVGNSTITAVKDGVMSNDGRLTVTAAALESIQITPAVVSLAKGNSQQYTALGFYSDDTSRNISNEVSWFSSTTTVATISEQGVAVGVGVGETMISAVKDGVMSNESSLMVTAAVVERIQISPAAVSLAKGNRQQYTALGFYSDDTSRDISNEVSWRSSVIAVVTISEQGMAVGVGVGETIISAIINGVMSNESSLTVTAAVVEHIQISPAVVSLAKGNRQQYTAMGFYSDETSRELTQEVSWRSRDTSIATISEAGLAIGVGVGNSTITAVKDGVMSNDGRLTVTAAALESIQITPAVVSFAKGNSQQYTAMGFYSDETSRELTQEVSWRSRDTSIATISEAGLAIGVGVGNSIITAVKDGVVSNDGRLTVTAVALESIQITPAVVSLAKGNSQQYTVLGFYSDDTSRNISNEVSWRSSATTVATISEQGMAVGVGVGKTMIRAVKDGVMSNESSLTVTAAVVERIQISSAAVSLAKGNRQQYTALGFYSDDTSRDISNEVSWRSSVTAVVTISEQGMAVGVDIGETIISAVKDGVMSNEANLTVTAAVVERIQISPAAASLAKGNLQQYTALGFYSDDTSRDISNEVSWRSSATRVATISEQGMAVGVDIGETSISAVKDGVMSNRANLIVSEAVLESIIISPINASIIKGSILQHAATGIYSDGVSQDLTQEVSWRSSDTSIATISEAGVAVGVGVGSSTINAVKDGIISNDGRLTVIGISEPVNYFVNVKPKNTVIFVGSAQQFEAELIYDDGSKETLSNDRVIWNSSAFNIVTITNTGRANGIVNGGTQIKATLIDNVNVWGETTLSVINVQSLFAYTMNVSGSNILNIGDKAGLTVNGLYSLSNSGFVDLTYSSIWTSSDPSVIRMEGPIMYAVGSGTATITASYEGRVSTGEFIVR
ncbi:Ig-like domain-containing protein [Aliivibrio fischeri]|uniref:Ig-like domain-containing protein n=1 Tax=Aliivibrio fischeri TaxID=668 RepID=UPI001BE40130